MVERALKLGAVLLEAGKRSARKRDYLRNAVVWPLPPDLTIKGEDFPTELFPVLFAIPRMAGYLSHWKESLNDPDTKIMRPAQSTHLCCTGYANLQSGQSCRKGSTCRLTSKKETIFQKFITKYN